MDVVYNSFEGRYSDSPVVLHRALLGEGAAHRHVWLADPRHAASFPEGVETVAYGSQEAAAALEAADLLVANTHTDMEWRKREGAVYLQIWHGTPLKRIHWDVLWAPPGRLERLSRDVERWDLLVSPNRVSTALLRRAFRYAGAVVETGYPRNDVLSSPERHEIRARVRRELGLGDGVRAVLYAPTWRDDVVFAEGGRRFSLELDVDAFERRLGRDHRLLLRLHYMLSERLEAAGRESVIDVSTHPDVSELYLAADVLVTDYSSVMFDFAVTGKPMAFFTYDLADYQGRLRGFYFDFAPQAPGPLVRTTDELLDALEGLGGLRDEYAERYARFREAYCHLEDGRATQRVLQAVAAAREGYASASPE